LLKAGAVAECDKPALVKPYAKHILSSARVSNYESAGRTRYAKDGATKHRFVNIQAGAGHHKGRDHEHD
jgi:hypothetical protein